MQSVGSENLILGGATQEFWFYGRQLKLTRDEQVYGRERMFTCLTQILPLFSVLSKEGHDHYKCTQEKCQKSDTLIWGRTYTVACRKPDCG